MPSPPPINMSNQQLPQSRNSGSLGSQNHIYQNGYHAGNASNININNQYHHSNGRTNGSSKVNGNGSHRSEDEQRKDRPVSSDHSRDKVYQKFVRPVLTNLHSLCHRDSERRTIEDLKLAFENAELEIPGITRLF
ncbi:hypothetical protein BX616_008706, partial [Lobosporangium transversale]